MGCTLAGVTGTIQVGGNPYGVAFSPDGTFAYTTNYGPDTLSMISTATNSVVNTIGAGPGVTNPDGIAFVPGSSTWAYFADSSGLGTIFVPTNWVVNPLNYSIQSLDVQFTPSGSEAYVVAGTYGTEGRNVTVINTATSAVVNTIVLPNQAGQPEGVAFSPNGNLAYVTDYLGNKVVVINVATNTVINSISVDGEPVAVSFADNNHAYVSAAGADKIDVINVATNAMTACVITAYIPYGITVSPTGNFALVATAGNALMINTVSNTVINSITTGTGYNYRMAIAANGKYAYLGSSGGAIGYINIPANTFTTLIATDEVSDMVIDPTSSTYVYAAQYYGGGMIYRIATATNAITSWGSYKEYGLHLAIPSTGGVAYETGYSSARLSIINLGSMSVVPSSVGATPNAIAVSSSGISYVVNGGSGTVTVVGPPSAGYPVLATVPVGTDPWGAAVSPNGQYVWVTNYGSGTVSVINTATYSVVATIIVGSNPTGLALSPNSAYLYVANSGSNSVSVITTSNNQVVATILVGSSPYGIAVAPTGDYIYVANHGSGTVLVINAATLSLVNTVVTPGGTPHAIAASPTGSYLYVTDDSPSSKVFVVGEGTCT